MIEDQDRRLWHRAAATIGPDDELAGEFDLMAARALRRGSLAMVIEILQIAAKLSSTAKARTERLLRAAEFAVDFGRPGLLEHLLRGAEVDASDKLSAARVGWCREISQPSMVNDPERSPSYSALPTRRAPRARRIWRATYSGERRNAAGGAARAPASAPGSSPRQANLELPELDPNFIAIFGVHRAASTRRRNVREVEGAFLSRGLQPP